MTKKTLIADDHPLVREGLQHVLKHINSEQVILQAEDYSQAQEIIKQHSDIDLILLDLCMPYMNGMASLYELRQNLPCTPIVIISASDNINDIQGAIKNGANGYIHKSSSHEIMLNALRLILSGGLYLPPQWNTQPSPENNTLTQRQKEVISLIALGKANKEIAREFEISDKTVKAHLSEIFKRLQVSNRTEAVHQARKIGALSYS